ncbi:MAG: hypothetical protein CMP24_04080 [Rickettsiales bacterium]|nr:hypothetical protein [Rickettsiales bacterium]
MKEFRLKIFPKDWIKAYSVLKKLTNLSNYKFLLIITIMMLVTFLEAFSLTLVLPLLELIKDQKNLISNDNNFLTEGIVFFFNYIGFPVKFVYLSTLIAIVVFLRQYFNFSLNKMLANIRANSNKALRKNIFESTFLSAPNSIEGLGNGSYVELMTNQSNYASGFVVHLIRYLSILLLSLFYFFISCSISFVITLIAIVLAVFLMMFANIIISKIKNISKKNVINLKHFSKYLSECFSSWKVIKLSNSYNYENSRNENWISKIAEQEYQREYNSAKSVFFISIIVMIFLIISLNIGVNIGNIELGMLVMFSIMCLRLLPLMLVLVSIKTRITISSESLSRLFEVLNDLNLNKEIDLGKKRLSMQNGIKFENITFKYPDAKKYIFKNFNCFIRFGDVTTISGSSGSGKSTLLDLLSRMYNTYRGKITIDKITIKKIGLIDYRSNISLLPQNPFIYDDTVKSNISYGYKRLREDDIIKAAKLANAHDFIVKLSKGYNTILGERGSKISGGQVQRIVLARILASKAKVIILDEPTSSLDYISSKKIINALKKIKKIGKYTLIIASHNEEIINLGDNIIQLHALD